MRQFFQMDGPIFSALSRAADLIILNIMFIISCLPIVTIGAALTAMSYATLKMKGTEEGYAWKNYIRSFKLNLKQATLIWLLMLVMLLVLGLDYRIADLYGGAFVVVRYAALLGLLLWIMVLLYVYPLLSRFENTVFQTIRNAFMLSVANLPRTLLMLVIMAAMVFITGYNSYTMAYGLLYWLVFGFGVLSFINSTLQYKIFERLMPAEAEEETGDTV